jgi:hypothetical protein
MATYSSKSNGVKINCDFSAMEDFNRTLEEYKKFSKKAPAEIINSKLFFIARQATLTTKKTSKEEISSGLDKPADDYPHTSIGSIIVQRNAMNSKGHGLKRNEIAGALAKLKKIRNKSIGYGRAGWLQAIKILGDAKRLGDIQFSNRFKPKMDTTVKQFGKILGSATFARNDQKTCWGEIVNSTVSKTKHPSSNFINVISNGLNEAIKIETQSMRIYIQRKLDEYFKKKH